MGSRAQVGRGADPVDEERDLAGVWIARGWGAALGTGAALLGVLLWLRGRARPEVLDLVGVFSYTLLGALVIVLATATLTWMRDRER